MKKILSALALTAVVSTSAMAGGYVGAKTGSMDVNYGLSTDMPIGLVAGYTFNTWSVESEITLTNFSHFSGGIDTFAVYGAYRSQGELYGKFKIGLLNEHVTAGPYSGSDTGLSLGFGGGFRINPNMAVEAEYTIIEQDADFLSIGFNYHF